MDVKDLPDYEQRLFLAKLIGLDEVPEPNEKSFDNLAGLFSDVFDGEVDAVELVKDVRRN